MLFVYGTLQDPDILGAVLGRQVDTAALPMAVAPGFRAVTCPGQVYPMLARAPHDAAPGRLLAGLDAGDVSLLDAFEGDQYYRGTIDILVGDRLCPAEAYLPRAAIAATEPAWSLANWTLNDKPAVVRRETDTAVALRRRLAARWLPERGTKTET